jgi:hypothetical protein
VNFLELASTHKVLPPATSGTTYSIRFHIKLKYGIQYTT